jgi:hypothetical protein
MSWRGLHIEHARGLKDPWGHDYPYSARGKYNEGKFALWSCGPDDDICNWKSER